LTKQFIPKVCIAIKWFCQPAHGLLVGAFASSP